MILTVVPFCTKVYIKLETSRFFLLYKAPERETYFVGGGRKSRFPHVSNPFATMYLHVPTPPMTTAVNAVCSRADQGRGRDPYVCQVEAELYAGQGGGRPSGSEKAPPLREYVGPYSVCGRAGTGLDGESYSCLRILLLCRI